MTTRIEQRFADLKKEGRAALVTFTMAGDPDYATSLALAKALPKGGADVIELGMPFTDPMADGPSIQAAGVRAGEPPAGGHGLRPVPQLPLPAPEEEAPRRQEGERVRELEPVDRRHASTVAASPGQGAGNPHG